MAEDRTEAEGLTPSQKLFQEAKRRFRTCEDFESNARKLFLDDVKFDAADPDNGYQWPNSLLNSRNRDDRPSLTINKTHQHNLQIINDGKQNTPSIKIIPVSGSDKQSADVFQGLCRAIEYRSNAKAAYDTGYSFAVRAGIGYCRVGTRYVGDDTFDQELYIWRVKDPLSIYLDPDINEVDGSDANFGFAFEDRPKDEVLDEYPDLKDKLTNAVIGDTDGWIDREHIRVCEYYRRVKVSDHLVLMVEPETLPDGTPNPRAGEQSIVKASAVPKEILDLAMKAPESKVREISRSVVEWFKIVGEEVVDERSLKKKNEIPIPYIPIARVVGEETVIEGKLDRKGHTRAQKDAQRMLNYNASAMVENGALQNKIPYIAPARAIEGLETYWDTANRVNHSVLPYNDVDDKGQPIQKPERQMPPTSAAAFTEGFTVADQQLSMVSGQYRPNMGEPSNERSGKAINARQRQGDNATYHYIDNLAHMIRYVGKIIVAWAPHVYDTRRVLKIMGDDGTEREVTIDPKQNVALLEKKAQQNRAAESIFNPAVGVYDVVSDIGPGYATKRQETYNALSQIAVASPQAMGIIGDLLFKNMDVAGADEMAERYRRSIPANILGEGPAPEVTALQGQLENVKGLLTDVVTQLAEKDLELKRTRADKSVESYNATTRRVNDMAKLTGGGDILIPVIVQAVTQALSQALPGNESDTQQPADMNSDGQDLPPLNDVPWDMRAQIDATLSNGNPNG
jgi:hypothetical protein